MKARLVSGEIVTLKKECECLTHDEPHWLHMNELHSKKNRKDYEWAFEKEASGNTLYYVNALAHYAKAEEIRLGNLRRELENRGIVELLPDDNNLPSD